MADPQPQVAPEPVTIAGFKGIKNTVTPERLSGEDLERARNVDLDDAGQARRRRGTTLVAAGNYHSVWTSDDGTVYGVKNQALGIIRPDFTFVTLAAGVGLDPIAYVQVGEDIYYSSRVTSGVITAGTVSAWGALVSAGTWLSPVVLPTSTLPGVAGKLLGAPPLAHALAYHNGRIYLASERTVWATELYMYRYVDKTRTYMLFESAVTVIGAVSSGLYVGTETALWFLSGPFAEMQRVKVLNCGVLPGSMVEVPKDLILPNQSTTRTALMAMTHQGLCALQDGGNVLNLTQQRVLFPEAVSAAAMFRQQDGINQYVGVLNSAGTPTSTARVGDYVDAEIRRFQGA
jgi:hypothetical protein